MQTAVGRVALSALLRLVEIYPLFQRRKRGVRKELRVIEAFGQRVKVRIFRPNGPVRGVVLDLHGGGWTIGNARMADGQNAILALRLNVAVVSMDYKLALTGPIRPRSWSAQPRCHGSPRLRNATSEPLRSLSRALRPGRTWLPVH